MKKRIINAAHTFAVAIGVAVCLGSAPLLANGAAGEQEQAVATLAELTFDKAQDYRLGLGVEPDMDRALQLYREAMELGHERARDDYGLLLYRQGKREAAMPLIVDAAERGDPRAQYVLALSHFNAEHAPKDWVRAYALMTLAHVGGMPQAREALGQMEEYIPAGQRAKAQVLVQEWTGRSVAEAQPALATSSAPPPFRSEKVTAQAEATPSREVRSGGEWQVQLGTFGVPGNAERLWSRLSSDPVLSGAAAEFAESGRYTVLRAGGFSDRAQAQDVCRALSRKGQDCLVQRP